MTGGHMNGSGRPTDDEGKVASLDAARRKAAERARQEKRAARDTRLGGAMSVRNWILGIVVVGMAAGMIWHWVAPLVQGTRGIR